MTKKEIVLKIADETDIKQIHVKKVVQKFLDEVTHIVELLDMHPEMGRSGPSSIRTVPTRRFPYSIVYRTAGDRLFVLAVAHQRRRPRYWSDRTSNG